MTHITTFGTRVLQSIPGIPFKTDPFLPFHPKQNLYLNTLIHQPINHGHEQSRALNPRVAQKNSRQSIKTRTQLGQKRVLGYLSPLFTCEDWRTQASHEEIVGNGTTDKRGQTWCIGQKEGGRAERLVLLRNRLVRCVLGW